MEAANYSVEESSGADQIDGMLCGVHYAGMAAASEDHETFVCKLLVIGLSD
jgi:hypothetical protein